MLKYGVAVVTGLLYVTVAAWVVRNEGRTYRDALRREARQTTAARTPEPRSRKAEPAPSVPVPRPEPPKTADPPAPVPPVTIAATAPAPRPAESAPPRIESARHWADALDLSRLKPEDELRLGQELHTQILAVVPPLDEGDYLQRVKTAAAPFLAARDRKDFPYTFTILNSDAVNAFSHPGGYVYVCQGLFDLIADDEDYILEFIVGHEIAHVELNHAVKLLAPGNAAAKARGIGTLQQFHLPIVMAYPDDREFEADAWAAARMLRDDRSRHEALGFLQKFKNYAERHKFPNGHKEPEPGALVFENHFRAHPAAWERIEKLKERLEALNRPKAKPSQ